ncbi:DUF4180 domain-containing protein [Pelagibacterium lentulum]|uniref:DUF4180 domain-containing protein n=1 Tax=Pelagibacterium lentulum TaxID=2029865 RepID=A0A916W148_9HYPH|nr:hypothetical protein GCM10011499_31690 [Pelagibacterium lentulum]
MQNYRMGLVMLGDISGQIARSKAFSEFVGEINRIGYHLFAADRSEHCPDNLNGCKLV